MLNGIVILDNGIVQPVGNPDFIKIAMILEQYLPRVREAARESLDELNKQFPAQPEAVTGATEKLEK